MNHPAFLFWAALALGLLNAALLIAVLLRRPQRAADAPSLQDMQLLTQSAAAQAAAHAQEQRETSVRLERELRQQIAQGAREGRQESLHALTAFQQTITRQNAEATRTQNAQIDAFAQQLALLQKTLADTLATQLQSLSENNARRLQEVRGALQQELARLQQGNAEKLDEMRRTVDEKLQTTLEQRLGESFRQVAERLEQVHRGLGEMHTLAQGVGDLKHLLANVKTRGIFGEAQLASLLEQVFTPEQYAAQVATRGAWGEVQLEALLEQVLAAGQFEKNVMTRPGSGERVEFAIRLPGRGEDGESVWLPIDAKFPTEDYERLLDAQQRADAPAAEAAARALEARLRQEARSMADKYLQPPHTTDFGILFLPAEGLYAEALRRPGLLQALQRECRITLAGPVTLLAMLNSLQMGFRTLALQKRSSEVWQVLGAVKTEFGKFGDVLTRIRSQTQTVLNTLEQAQTRSNVMHRALKQVEALPESAAQTLLSPAPPSSRPAAESEAPC